mmetsp:Transcript_25439/g.73323  ORF Transcript_25439/g.73323 Transcript_25439/m.73323 type:complete len:265 (-) Transcript_25439:256-1050(-)
MERSRDLVISLGRGRAWRHARRRLRRRRSGDVLQRRRRRRAGAVAGGDAGGCGEGAGASGEGVLRAHDGAARVRLLAAKLCVEDGPACGREEPRPRHCVRVAQRVRLLRQARAAEPHLQAEPVADIPLEGGASERGGVRRVGGHAEHPRREGGGGLRRLLLRRGAGVGVHAAEDVVVAGGERHVGGVEVGWRRGGERDLGEQVEVQRGRLVGGSRLHVPDPEQQVRHQRVSRCKGSHPEARPVARAVPEQHQLLERPAGGDGLP